MKMKMKKVSCYLTVKALVECPHCSHMFDLFDVQDLLDDGYIYEELLNESGFGHTNWNQDVTCPKCQSGFIIENVEY